MSAPLLEIPAPALSVPPQQPARIASEVALMNLGTGAVPFLDLSSATRAVADEVLRGWRRALDESSSSEGSP